MEVIDLLRELVTILRKKLEEAYDAGYKKGFSDCKERCGFNIKDKVCKIK
jgi:ribosome modulation factor